VIDTRIIKRYAAAIFKQAQKNGVLDLVESDLGLISYTFESNPKLEQAIASPLVPPSKKVEVVKAIFGGKIQEISLHYLYLLINNRREEVIKGTESEFVKLANDARGIVIAEVTSAVELTEDELVRLRAKLSEQTGKKAELITKIEPGIIGGLVVRIGDTVMDGSVKGHLHRIREEFLEK
jgi:F-type H+-transporting ATPase subunit delta